MGTAGCLRAVIWADGDEWERWVEQCIDYCERRRYEVVALVLTHTGGRWEGVEQLIRDGRADVAVVADRDQVPVGRRIEAVTDDPYWTAARDAPVAATPQRPWSPGRPTLLR